METTRQPIRAGLHKAQALVAGVALATALLVGFGAGRMTAAEPGRRVAVHATSGPAVRNDVPMVMIRPHHRGTVKEG